MSSKFLSVLAGVALAASATSAFAFEAVLSSPKALHTHPWHRSGVIEVLGPATVINITGCRHGWCQAQAPNGPVGFVYTPVLVGAAPAPGGWWGWGAGAGPAPVVASY
jgi:SH3-like domain-containing protein